MPTNNQEKWSLNDKVRMWFCRISPVPYPMKKEFTATEEMLIQEMESFLRQEIRQAVSQAYEIGFEVGRMKGQNQEIRQAKIETLEDLYGIYHAFDWGVYDPFTIIQKKISNLKQNDQPTKN
jgi:hypothetical protein